MTFARLLFIFSLLLLPMSALAQEDTELSAEEIVLLDRMIDAFEYRGEASSYAYTWTSDSSFSMELFYERDSVTFEETSMVEQDGYLLRDSSGNVRDYFTIKLSGEDEHGEYERSGTVTFIEGIVYLETPDDFYVIESDADIPEEYLNAGLDDLFDDDEGVLQDRELMLDVLDSASEEDVEVDDETLTLLTFTVADNRIGALIWELFNPDVASDNPTLLALREYGEGTVLIEVWLDADDHVRRSDVTLDVTAADVDLSKFGEQYVGNILDNFHITQEVSIEVDQYDAEFDPIEIPSEPL